MSILLCLVLFVGNAVHATQEISKPFYVTMNDARYDTTFKVLFGQNEKRVASLLNSILRPEPKEQITTLKFLDPNRVAIKDRTIIFDVSIQCECETLSGHRYIVEMQKAHVRGYSNRWIYYGSRELVDMGQILSQNMKAPEGEDEDRKNHTLRGFYKNLVPVKVVTIFDFEPPHSELCNKDDVVVHWNICEERSKNVASKLLSWTFVILPRFLKEMNLLPQPPDFTGNILGAWLYLLTRTNKEKVVVTEKVVAGCQEISGAFRRISHLRREEKRQLRDEQDAEAMQLGLQDDIKEDYFNMGNAKGKIEGKLESKMEGAVNLIKENQPIELIVKCMGLSVDVVTELKRTLESGQDVIPAKRVKTGTRNAEDGDAQSPVDSDAPKSPLLRMEPPAV